MKALTDSQGVFVTFRDEELVRVEGYIKTSVFICLECGNVVTRNEYEGGDVFDNSFCNCGDGEATEQETPEPTDRKVLVRAFDQWSDPAGECWAIAGSVDEGIAEVIDQLNEWQDDDAERTAYLRENGTYSVLVNGDWDGYTSICWDYVDELPAHLEHLPAEAIEREIANARWEDARADAAWLGHTF